MRLILAAAQPVADETTMSTPTQDTGNTIAQAGATSALFVMGKLEISTWSDVANVVVVLYTLHLITDWWWKRFWRPFFERRGWLQPKAPKQVEKDDE